MSSRFGNFSKNEIKNKVENSIPVSTSNTQNSIWRQFMAFCNERNFKFEKETSIKSLADILEDWAFNMKKSNDEEYKEGVIKTIWNTTAKMLQEKYFKEYNVTVNPFDDIQFKEARDARNSK